MGLMRYKSLKTIPTPTTSNTRRVLVYPISQNKYNEAKDNYYSNYYIKENYMNLKEQR
jgi:hypothetical protein